MSIYDHCPRYRNKKTGTTYVRLRNCQVKIDDTWVDGIIYMDEAYEKTYVRTLGDWCEKFEPVTITQ
jgi:hypothetical protein